MNEFNFGVQVSQTVNCRIMADTHAKAEEIFMEVCKGEGTERCEKSVLAVDYTVLGMIEGPLPPAPTDDIH